MSDTNQITEAEQHTTNEHKVLEHSPVSRRNFMRLSAASVGSLAFSETALASHTSPKASELYEFIRNQVPEDYEIPTLIFLTDKTGFNALDMLNLTEEGESLEFIQTTDPTLAAYAKLTPEQSRAVLELSEVEQVEYSPGSNPFWKLGEYNNGVFPAASDSVGYIAFEQMIDGFKKLASAHSDRLNFFSRGHSAGYRNLFKDTPGQKHIWFAEMTNNIDDEGSFEDKQKVIFNLSIHGDEPQGREAGCRLAERIFNGNVPNMDEFLEEVVVIFVFINPDGWVVRNPQYIGSSRVGRTGFNRQNGADRDLNRSNPTDGWIDPENYPGESWGTNLEDDQPGEVDDDVPGSIAKHVPEALTVVEQIRSYENVGLFMDMHGMGSGDPVLMYMLTPNGKQFNHHQLHDLYELTRSVGKGIREDLGSVDQQRDAILDGLKMSPEIEGDVGDQEIPDALYRDGTGVDTLGYESTGNIRTFVAGRDKFSGLDIPTVTPEFQFSSVPFDQDVVELHRDAYMRTIRETIKHAISKVEATIATDNRSTAYITTDALTRSSDDLVFAETPKVKTRETVTPGPDEPGMVRFTVAEKTEELVIDIESDGNITATLLNPAGEAVQSFDAATGESGDAEWNITDPAPGEWTVQVENDSDDEVDVTVIANEYLGEDDNGNVLTPDPIDALGFEQHKYKVTPFQYFKDNSQFLVTNSNSNKEDAQNDQDDHTNPLMDPVSISEVNEGGLFDNGEVAYDNVVVIHDEPAGSSECLDELDAFVNAGGNLVLTDTGVQLLSQLETDLAGDITENDVKTTKRQFTLLGDEPYTIKKDGIAKNLDHRLLENVQPVQQQLTTTVGLGYATPKFEIPMTLVNADAFETVGGEIAATTDGQVSVGALEHDDGETGIQVIGGVLPPAYQRNLHPFGMLDYGVKFLGHTVLINALGYEQRRFVNGERVTGWGDTEYPGNGEVEETDDADDIYQGPSDDDDGDDYDADGDGAVDEDDEDTDDDDDSDGNNRDDDGDGAIDEDNDRK